MTSNEIINYYARLLILQYRGKTRAFNTVKTFVGPIVMDQIPAEVRDAFTLGTAVGVQLDVIGKYIGASRVGNTFNAPVSLSDDDYTTLLQMRIIQNASGSSLAEIQALIHRFFPTTIRVFDYKDMRISYFFDSTGGSQELAQVFVKDHFLPKPMGVQLGALIFYPGLDSFFGFRTYEHPAVNVTSFNTYSSYHMDRPWLSYAFAVAV